MSTRERGERVVHHHRIVGPHCKTRYVWRLQNATAIDQSEGADWVKYDGLSGTDGQQFFLLRNQTTLHFLLDLAGGLEAPASLRHAHHAVAIEQNQTRRLH